jgi:hypothetical protein
LVALLHERLLFSFQLCNRLRLLARILLPFFFDLFYAFFDPCDSESDFFLFLLQLLKSDDLVAKLREIGRLGSAFAAEIDFTPLEEAPFVTQCDTRSLATDFQSNLAEAGANETHGVKAASVV